MLTITKENNSIKVVGSDNYTYPYSGTLVFPLSSITVVTDSSDMAVFRSSLNNDTLFSAKISDIMINGETVTKENIGIKFGNISNISSGSGSGAVDSVNGQTGAVVLTASDVNAYSKAETDGKLSNKQNILVSGTNIKTINGQTVLGEGNIEIQGSGSGITDAPSDGNTYGRKNGAWENITEIYATKQDLNSKADTSDLSNYLTTANAETTYAKKNEIPSLDGYLQTSVADSKYATKTELSGKADASAIADMLTKTEASEKYQPKGEYATTSQLDAKQDTLVSGTNIKTVNGNSLLGNGNIVIEGGSSEPKVWSTINNEDFYNNAKVGDIIELNFPFTKLIIQDIRNGNGNQGTSGPNKTYTCSYYIDSYTKGREKVSVYQFIVLKSDYSVTTVEIRLATQNDLTKKQDTLVSGESIKTINGNSLLGSGDITIEGGGSGIATWDYAQLQSQQEYRTNFLSNVKVSDDLINLGGSDNPEHASILTIDGNVYTVMYNVGGNPKVASINIQESVATITNIDAIPKNVATTTENGLMSSADKTKLDSIDVETILSRIAALETQMGEVSARLDNINGEVVK